MELPPEASRQDGRFSFLQARAVGVSRRQLDRAVTGGVLLEVRQGVYVESERPAERTELDRHRAEVIEDQLAFGPGWFAARRSAALLLGLPVIGRAPDRAQLLRDAAGTHAHGRDRHARVGRLPRNQTMLYDDVPVVSPARAVADIGRAESFRNAVVVADAALRRGMEREELQLVLRQMRRWPGVAHARRVAAFADGRAESPGESLVRVACLLEGLPAPEPQVEIWRYDVFVARVDLLIQDALLVIESDGGVKFTDAGVLPALLARQEAIRDCGLEVLRTDWGQTFKNTDLFARRVRDRMASAASRRLAPGVRLVSTQVRVQAPVLSVVRQRKAG